MPLIALYPYNSTNVYSYAPSYDDYENGVMAVQWENPLLIEGDTNSFVETAGDGVTPIGRVLVSLFEDVLGEMPAGSRIVWVGGSFDAWWSYTTATYPGPVSYDLTIGVDAVSETGALVPAPLAQTLVPATPGRWVTYRLVPFVPHYEADGIYDEAPETYWNALWVDLGAAYTPAPVVPAPGEPAEEAPGPLVRFSFLRGELFYVGPPAVANLYQPAATITTSTPVARWDYASGADGGPMAAYKIDVWEGSTPGFGPVVYRSGVVYSSEPSHEMGALALGPHVMQLSVAQWVGDALHWAPPFVRTFTVNVSPPGDPIVNATPSNADGWIELAIFVSGARAADAIEIERSPDGVTWEVAPFTAGMSEIVTGASELRYRDVYTYGNTVPTYYRVRTTRYAAGQTATSDWTQVGPVAWSSPDVFIKIAGRPWMTTSFALMADSLREVEYPQDRGVFYVRGRKNPVVVSGGRNGAVGTIHLGIVDADEFPVIKRAALNALLAYDPWLLQAPDSFAGWSNKWVSVGEVTERRPIPKIDKPQRVFTLPVTEQDPSPTDVIDLDAPGGVAGWLPWWVEA